MGFTWNGVSCETLDMHVEAFPPRPFPARKQTVYKIPGRSGDLIVDEDAYENVTQEYEVYVNHSTQGLQANLTAIAAWLLGPVGYCELTDTYDPTVKRQARFVGGMEFINSLNRYGKATAVFDCKPQRWPKTDVVYSGTLAEGITTTITLPASGLLDSYPLLELDTIGANTSFRVTTGTLVITVPARGASMARIIVDWETQSVYNPYNGRIPSGSTVSGDWTKIGDGDAVSILLETNPAPTYKFYPRQYSV